MKICALTLFLFLPIICFHYFSFFFKNFNFIYSTGISWKTHDIKTWPLTDLSGYFIIGFNSSTSIAKICKYTNKETIEIYTISINSLSNVLLTVSFFSSLRFFGITVKRWKLKYSKHFYNYEKIQICVKFTSTLTRYTKFTDL